MEELEEKQPVETAANQRQIRRRGGVKYFEALRCIDNHFINHILNLSLTESKSDHI